MTLVTQRLAKLDYEDAKKYATDKKWSKLPSPNHNWYGTVNASMTVSWLLSDIDVIILSFKYGPAEISGSNACKMTGAFAHPCYPAAEAMAQHILDIHGSAEAYFKKKLELSQGDLSWASLFLEGSLNETI